MLACFLNNVRWRNYILEIYQTRFYKILETIDNLAFMKMDERLHKYLINKTKLQAIKILIVKHQDIAENLHISNVTFPDC